MKFLLTMVKCTHCKHTHEHFLAVIIAFNSNVFSAAVNSVPYIYQRVNIIQINSHGRKLFLGKALRLSSYVCDPGISTAACSVYTVVGHLFSTASVPFR